MIETECQQLLIDAARSVGGVGLKLNNRFLVGVVDLLIKLPKVQPVWLEAKLIKLSAKTTAHVWDVGCTAKQKDFLRQWNEAGMRTGVASFIETKGKGIKGLSLWLYSYGDMLERQWASYQVDHCRAGDHLTRLDNLATLMQGFAAGVTNGG